MGLSNAVSTITEIVSSIQFLEWSGILIGLAICYGLDGPVIESRWGASFSAPVQTDPGARPASCTMATMSLSRG